MSEAATLKLQGNEAFKAGQLARYVLGLANGD